VQQSIRDMGSQLRDTASEQYSNLRQQATDYYQQGRERAVEWRDQLEDYVREQPVKSLLIAAGIGALFGILWRR
jgi:ElaB/YqjD/DUF883 family membrane-anchored ribosome-binding protein